MKRIFAWAMVVLLCIQPGVLGFAQSVGPAPSTPDPVYGTAPDTQPPQDQKPISNIYWSDNLPQYVMLLPQGGDIDSLTPLLPYPKFCFTDQYELVRGVTLRWDWSAADLSTPGLYSARLEMALPTGYYQSPDLILPEPQLLVYDPSQVGALDAVGVFYSYSPMIVPRGTDEAARAAFQSRHRINEVGMQGLRSFLENKDKVRSFSVYTIKDKQGQEFSAVYAMNYDTDLVDMNTAGSYPIFSGLPPYFAQNKNVQQRLMLHVLDPKQVDLRAWTINGFGQIGINWFYPVESPTLWVRVDSGSWMPAEDLDEEGYTLLPGGLPFTFDFDSSYTRYNSLLTVENGLILGHTYEFEVRYENGGISVNSFVMDLRDGYSPSYGNGGGSRDGIDRDEVDDLPPAPVPPTGPGTVIPAPPRQERPAEPDLPAPTGTDPVPTQPIQPTQPAPNTAADPATPRPPASGPGPLTATAPAPPPQDLGQADGAPAPAGPDVPFGDTGTAPPAPGAPSAPPAPAPIPDPPPSAPAAVAVVALGGAAGAAVLWKLLGKYLVKKR